MTASHHCATICLRIVSPSATEPSSVQPVPCLMALQEKTHQPNNKTKHEKDRWTLFSTPAWWERCHTPTDPAQHRPQQCCARAGSREHTAAPSVQPPAELTGRNGPKMPCFERPQYSAQHKNKNKSM